MNEQKHHLCLLSPKRLPLGSVLNVFSDITKVVVVYFIVETNLTGYQMRTGHLLICVKNFLRLLEHNHVLSTEFKVYIWLLSTFI